MRILNFYERQLYHTTQKFDHHLQITPTSKYKLYTQHTLGVMLSIWVRRLKVIVEPTADPWRRPISTKMASAGRRNRLVNSTFKARVDLGEMETNSPFGTRKSLESCPASKTWYWRGLPLGLLSFTWRWTIQYLWSMKFLGRTLFELSRYNEVWTDRQTDRRTDGRTDRHSDYYRAPASSMAGP